MDDLPETAAYYRECLSIPLYVDLSNAQQAAFIAAALESMTRRTPKRTGE
jgi:hypothetical protein